MIEIVQRFIPRLGSRRDHISRKDVSKDVSFEFQWSLILAAFSLDNCSPIGAAPSYISHIRRISRFRKEKFRTFIGTFISRQGVSRNFNYEFKRFLIFVTSSLNYCSTIGIPPNFVCNNIIK